MNAEGSHMPFSAFLRQRYFPVSSDVRVFDEHRVRPPGFDGEARFEAIFDSVNDAIFIMSTATGEVLEVNLPACRMFGYEREELIGSNVMGILSSGIHPYTEEMAFERVGKKAAAGVPELVQWQSKTKEGVLLWTEISVRYTTLDNVPVMISVLRDVSERRRLDAEVLYMAQHDVLTGLANRSKFETALTHAIAQSQRTGTSFAVLSLDLDRFKDVNDTRGHLAGDRLLQLVAERLQGAIRLNECVARFGGDEFAVLLSDLREPTEIVALASWLIVSIGKPFVIDGQHVHVGVSIGVSTYGDDACDVETLLSHADIALYKAKDEGRNTYRFYSEAMNLEVRSRVALTDELRQAIPAGQLFLAYQPQVTAKGGRVTGVEALVRWRHPSRGALMPGDFLPVAESSGLIGPLGQWVLREACRQARVWLDDGILRGTISVNFSSAEFRVPSELEKTVLAVLAETGLPPNKLELEITEATLISLSTQHEEMI